MANNYTHFSFGFKLRNQAEADFLNDLIDKAENFDSGDEESDELVRDTFPDFDDYGSLGFQAQITMEDDGGEAIIFSDGGEGNVEFAVNLVQEFMLKFKVEKPIAFEFAFTCSSPRPGEFGGGAVVVTAHDDVWLNTAQWIAETLKEME